MKKVRRPVTHARSSDRAAESDADPEAFAERALDYDAVVVDASSLIVLADIGALAAARLAWRLRTISAAANEAGPVAEGIELLKSGAESEAGSLSTDRALVAAARRSRLPLLSEDRKVLMAGEATGLDCLDALVALELLAAKGALTADEYDHAGARLLERNLYKENRLRWARAVGNAAAKLA